jgi:hypothetical protein
MATNTHMSNASANAAANAVAALCNGGTLSIYNGTQPANGNTAVTTQTLLATLPLSATAFGAAVNGVITANAITSASAVATGTATWFRIFKSDGTTAVIDGNVDIAANSPNLALNSTAISAGATVQVTSFTHTLVE